MRNILPVYIIGFIFLLAFNDSDPTGMITGKVTNSEGKPVVKRVVGAGGEYDFTDLKGNYRLDKVPYGTHILAVVSKGDTLRQIRVHVDTTHLHINISLP